eukprot:jgi/Galph1/1564/GphlegSOOS_G251.1
MHGLIKKWVEILIIIGNGPLSSKLIPQYTAEKGIFWIGCINNELRKTKIISSSDIFYFLFNRGVITLY